MIKDFVHYVVDPVCDLADFLLFDPAARDGLRIALLIMIPLLITGLFFVNLGVFGLIMMAVVPTVLGARYFMDNNENTTDV